MAKAVSQSSTFVIPEEGGKVRLPAALRRSLSQERPFLISQTEQRHTTMALTFDDLPASPTLSSIQNGLERFAGKEVGVLARAGTG